MCFIGTAAATAEVDEKLTYMQPRVVIETLSLDL